MEAFEDQNHHSTPIPLSDSEISQSQQRQQEEAELGFQYSKASLSSDANSDHPIVDDKRKLIATQELQNLSLKEAVDEEAKSMALKDASDDERKDELNETGCQEIASLEVCNEELGDRSLGWFFDEVVHDHASKKTEASEGETGNEDDGKGGSKSKLQNSASEQKEVNSDHQGDVRDENQNGTDEVEEEDGADSDRDNRSENENEVEKESSKPVGGESGPVTFSSNGKYRRHQYPLRPDAIDCPHYMRTGMCKFGSNCKFNHPPKRKTLASKGKVKQKEDNLERPGPTACKYYLTSMGCKYGKACRYNHHGGNPSVAPILEYNFLGLPIRPGEKECPYYMRNGSCKYGSNCRFNHPDPTAVGATDPSLGYGNGGSTSTMSSWSSPRTLNETASYVPMMFPLTQGIPSSSPEWNGYQAPVYPTSERSLPTPPAFAMNNLSTDTNFYQHHRPQHMLVEEFPERPGQLECNYFMKTGDCKYRSACKFHHPKSRIPKMASCVLSDRGLPLRPDQSICTHYNRYGICKFGPACKFDHPVNYGDSVSSAGSGRDQGPHFANPATADGASD